MEKSKKNNKQINIRSSAAEYLTFVSATGDDEKYRLIQDKIFKSDFDKFIELSN